MTQYRTREERARSWITRLANAPMPLNLLEWGDFSNMVLGHAIAADTASAACADLQAENERLREALEREEKTQCAIIQERDDAEEALTKMYQSVMGEPPEWSSGFGHAAAIADTEEYVHVLRQRSLAATPEPSSGRTDRERPDWAEEALLRDVSLCSHMTVQGDISYSIGGDGMRFPSIRAAIDAAMGREARDE